MTNVVELRPQPSLFDQAWSLFPVSGRQRSSRQESLAAWKKVVKDKRLSEQELLDRIRRYVRDDTNHRSEKGAPGFHRWLNWGRYDVWEPLEAIQSIPAARFPNETLRAAFHLAFHDERPRKWLDTCVLRGDEIVSPTRALREEWLYGPFVRWAKLNGIGGIRYN